MDIDVQKRRDLFNALGSVILASCIEVHRQMGPGLLESIYEECLVNELRQRNVCVDQRVPIKLHYKSVALNKLFVIDMVVEKEIILELKAVEGLDPLYEAQLLSYLKLADKRLGYLINFNVPLLKQGFRRMVNNF